MGNKNTISASAALKNMNEITKRAIMSSCKHLNQLI